MPNQKIRVINEFFYFFLQDFRAINNFVKIGEKKVGKRLLQDDSDNENPPKRLCEDLTLRKIQNVMTERQAGNGNGLPD